MVALNVQYIGIWGNLISRIEKIENKDLLIVGNKTKGRISKQMFQENKSRQIFRKTNISYPLIRTPETPVLKFVLLPYY